MPQGVPLSAEMREAIRADLEATLGTPQGSMRLVASRHGVSESTVRKVRDEAGLMSSADAQAKTKNAVESARLNNAARRAAIAKRLLDVADQALDDMDRAAFVFNIGGKDNTYTQHPVDKPVFADRRQLVTIAAIALDKHAMLEKIDTDVAGGSDMDRFLEALAGRKPGHDGS